MRPYYKQMGGMLFWVNTLGFNIIGNSSKKLFWVFQARIWNLTDESLFEPFAFMTAWAHQLYYIFTEEHVMVRDYCLIFIEEHVMVREYCLIFIEENVMVRDYCLIFIEEHVMVRDYCLIFHQNVSSWALRSSVIFPPSSWFMQLVIHIIWIISPCCKKTASFWNVTSNLPYLPAISLQFLT